MIGHWQYDDGGRLAEAGFAVLAPGDCATRAIAIATGMPYREVYDEINRLAKAHERKGTRKRGISNARTGVYRATMHRFMERIGWEWTPTMSIGSGCTVHVRADELPGGTLVLNLSKHYSAMINGVVYDTHDPTRDGTRCVYGYWRPPER